MKPEEAANRLGLSYLSVGDKAFRHAWATLPDVNRGGKIKHIIFGEFQDVEVTGFQFSMLVHTGQVPITIIRTIFSSESPFVPTTFITPRHFVQRFAMKLGIRRGVFTGDVAFDSRWRVRCADHGFVRELFTEPLCAHIQSKPGVSWRFLDGRICIIYGGKMRADRIESSIERLLKFHTLAAHAMPQSDDPR